jgi:FtsH-binding integral membrane protein
MASLRTIIITTLMIILAIGILSIFLIIKFFFWIISIIIILILAGFAFATVRNQPEQPIKKQKDRVIDAEFKILKK